MGKVFGMWYNKQYKSEQVSSYKKGAPVYNVDTIAAGVYAEIYGKLKGTTS